MPAAAPPAPPLRSAGPVRTAVERRSKVVLVALSRQPAWLLPVLTALLLAGAVFAPAGGGAVCLAALLLLVGWLSYLSWPAVDTRGRVLRVLSLVLLGALGLRVTLG